MAMAVVLARQKPCHSVKIESGAAAYIYIYNSMLYIWLYSPVGIVGPHSIFLKSTALLGDVPSP